MHYCNRLCASVVVSFVCLPSSLFGLLLALLFAGFIVHCTYCLLYCLHYYLVALLFILLFIHLSTGLAQMLMACMIMVTQLVLTSYVFGTLLHMLQVYSLCLVSYWSPVKYSHSVWHPIGHLSSIFTLSGILLVTCQVYLLCLAPYW